MNLRHVSSLVVCPAVIVPHSYEAYHEATTMPDGYGLHLAENDTPYVVEVAGKLARESAVRQPLSSH